jgi:pimeloyl-ACP methyl ester carboxylesterase
VSVSAARLPGTERLVLDAGAVDWLDRPSGPGPFPGALFFHGADHCGAHQPAAIVARRALVDAGFVVLAPDHPGYGESPNPALDAGVDAWDPAPSARAAYRALDAQPDVAWILAVGHSMGTSDVLGLLATQADVAAAVLFGAATSAPLTPYWYQRFHSDRHLEQGSIPVEKWRAITRFYDRDRLAAALPDTGVAILFAIHGIEAPHARHERDVLYQLLPEPKELWPLGRTTHYFSTAQRAGILVGDTAVSADLSLGLRRFAQALLERRSTLSRSGAHSS